MRRQITILISMVIATTAVSGCLTVLGLDDEYQEGKGVVGGETGDGTGGESSTSGGVVSTDDAGGSVVSAGGTGGGGMNSGGAGGEMDTTGASGGGSTSGGSSSGPCSSAEDCPKPSNECLAATCADGQCSTENRPAGYVADTQAPGDCNENQCDGFGSVIEVVNDDDLPNDGNQCTGDDCAAGVPMHESINFGQPCTDDGGAICNGIGQCVKRPNGQICTTDTECASNDCKAFFADTDQDNYGNPGAGVKACSTWPAGYVDDSSDCNDVDPFIHPDTAELCDAVDNNCDGTVNEGIVCNACEVGTTQGCVYHATVCETLLKVRASDGIDLFSGTSNLDPSGQSFAVGTDSLQECPGCQYCADGSGWGECLPGAC